MVLSNTFKRSAILLVAAASIHAADFPFFVTLRAGQPGPGAFAGSHELGIGGTAAANAATADFEYSNGIRWWRRNFNPQNFEIGYVASTNTGYVSVFNNNGTPVTATFTNPSAAIQTNAIWTIPSSLFSVSATGGSLFENVSISNLGFSGGVSILSGALPGTLAANGLLTPTASAPSTIVFDAASAGGNWVLSGQISFLGLSGNFGSAQNDSLRFNFGATGSDPLAPAPEPGSIVLMTLGIFVLSRYARRRAAGVRE